jgi:hypothetical protein
MVMATFVMMCRGCNPITPLEWFSYVSLLESKTQVRIEAASVVHAFYSVPVIVRSAHYMKPPCSQWRPACVAAACGAVQPIPLSLRFRSRRAAPRPWDELLVPRHCNQGAGIHKCPLLLTSAAFYNHTERFSKFSIPWELRTYKLLSDQNTTRRIGSAMSECRIAGRLQWGLASTLINPPLAQEKPIPFLDPE